MKFANSCIQLINAVILLLNKFNFLGGFVMGCKIVIVSDRDISREIDFVSSVYPNAEIWVFSSFDGSYEMNDHCVSYFDRTNLVGVDHKRQVVSLKTLNSRDFYMVSYDVLFIFSEIKTSKNLKKKESA